MIDEVQLAADSARIEQALDELRGLVPLPAFQRIEDLLRRVLGVYGAGLERALEHARAAGADDSFDARLAGDELLASLLVLHGLHPTPIGERVEEALAALRRELGAPDDALVVDRIDGGTIRLRAAPLAAGAMSPRLAESIVRRVVESAAPEATAIVIEGLPALRDPELVQLRVHRAAP
ncbi:MAG TPA: hypothetical protein VHE35_05225 [Kofleriaceae bacterium]|nr:hypothetical protein [Kofleriaceae bacterium]